jgi:hypothetical protein
MIEMLEALLRTEDPTDGTVCFSAASFARSSA